MQFEYCTADTNDLLKLLVEESVGKKYLNFADMHFHNLVNIDIAFFSCSLTELPEMSVSEMGSHFKQLMVEADSMDMIHDVLIKVSRHEGGEQRTTG